jgi:hypothetical protein
MGVLKNLFRKIKMNKDPDSKAFRLEMAKSVCGQHIKYVTEKIDGVEEVIGRSGGLNVRNDEFIVYASTKVLFRCKLDEVHIWELLSKDGVVISGPDIENGGAERTVIAFYVYHRK